jgi:hypothetical protein
MFGGPLSSEYIPGIAPCTLDNFEWSFERRLDVLGYYASSGRACLTKGKLCNTTEIDQNVAAAVDSFFHRPANSTPLAIINRRNWVPVVGDSARAGTVIRGALPEANNSPVLKP